MTLEYLQAWDIKLRFYHFIWGKKTIGFIPDGAKTYLTLGNISIEAFGNGRVNITYPTGEIESRDLSHNPKENKWEMDYGNKFLSLLYINPTVLLPELEINRRRLALG